MKDTKTALLVMLSIGLVGTWVFYFYNKANVSQQGTLVPNNGYIVEQVRDSLNQVYHGTLTEMDSRLDSTLNHADSLKNVLGSKLAEINLLKTEIDSLLKIHNAGPTELEMARVKINDLQHKVNELTTQKEAMATEKQQLLGLLAQLSGKSDNIRGDIIKLGDENRALNEKVNQSAVFSVSDLRINPVQGKDNPEAGQFIVSFDVKNTVNEFNNAELYVVVIQPDGKVLRNDIWETAYIETRSAGRKIYTTKLRFDYQKGENKHLLFYLNADDYQKGNYTLQLYQNGYLISQAVKSIS